MLRRADGTPFYIDGTMPMALIRVQRFELSATANSGTGQSITLDSSTGNPHLYFIRFEQVDGWGYQCVYSGNHTMIVGASRSGTVSGYIYVFGMQVQTPPTWGIAIYNAAGECVLTNETRVLKGLDTATPTGSPGTAVYLNEVVSGKKAIIPGKCGMMVYRGGGAGGPPGIAAEPYNTGCYWDGSNTMIASRRAVRDSQIIPLVQNQGSGYAPKYIDCTLYD